MTVAMPQKKRRSARPITPNVAPERIAERAYAKWQERGSPISDGLADWYAAQAELESEQPKRTRGRSLEHHAG